MERPHTRLRSGRYEKQLTLTLNDNNLLRESNKIFQHGQIHTGTVISNDQGRIEISLRKHEEDTIPEFEVGDIAKAFVIETNKKGCFLRLGDGWTGKCLLKDLADTFVADPFKEFPSGRLVAGYISKVDTKKRFVNLNLRESKVVKDEDRLTFDEIEKGDMLPGVVTRIESYGGEGTNELENNALYRLLTLFNFVAFCSSQFSSSL